MREAVFIKQNIDKWHRYEYLITHDSYESPVVKSQLYMDLTSDLSFAQTHYPKAEITQYLNELTIKVHNDIYKEKHEQWSRIVTFWTQEVPAVLWRERKYILISLAIFLVSIAVGILSTMHDESFARLVLGDEYIKMTLANIEDGKPMNVYAMGSESTSFMNIMFNNVQVSFLAFIMGIFTSIAVGYFLFTNGLMVGTFFTFLFQQGVLAQSWAAVMLHGTLELTAIVIAGGAGIAFGNGWLFPGTYKRTTALMRSAKRGLKIIVGTVPVFVVAAFIEGFFTRHFEWPFSTKLGFILLSAAFVVFYYLIYPYWVTHYGSKKKQQ